MLCGLLLSRRNSLVILLERRPRHAYDMPYVAAYAIATTGGIETLSTRQIVLRSDKQYIERARAAN